ncbi:MAG: CocE/NonD family hydrolase [Sedimentisphaerales bacterium]|nr:CocE/NonD family hydrolase [Sedimentisphaerales bacterium]
MKTRTVVFLLSLFVFQVGFVRADNRADYIRENYTKYEKRIPMRDGVKLFTAIYTPNDTSKKYPILLLRTPYSISPYGPDQYRSSISPHEEFEKEGFIFVYQDVRGRFMSEGEFVHMRPHVADKKSKSDIDESTDTYDTIEWLVEHVPNHNGKVGQWGISYPGFYTSAGAIDSHPALKAVSPQAPVSDFYWDDVYHHGAFMLSHWFGFLNRVPQRRKGLINEWPDPICEIETTDAYKFFMDVGPLKNVNERYFKGKSKFWNQVSRHTNYDKFWQKRNILPHLKNINAAVMTVGGWYDREDLFGPLHTYESIEKHNPDTFNIMVMGPWYHGGWLSSQGSELGDTDFGFATSKYFQNHIDLDFFKHFLKDEETELNMPEAMIFETGANRWRRFNQWPPASAKKTCFYFHDGGALSCEKPNEAGEAHDSYISDPDKPVPHTRDNSQWINNTFYAEDQRFASRRPDVLVYQTDVLEEDVTLVGTILANLFVSTTGTDSDWIVKLIDVYPDDLDEKAAQQALIRAEVFRGRFRESYKKPKPFVPNEMAKVSFELWDVLHTFKRGHRIMIHVQSTWFPFIDRNPQKYVPNIFEANEDDFIKATHRVYRSKEHPSHIEVGVLQQMF